MNSAGKIPTDELSVPAFEASAEPGLRSKENLRETIDRLRRENGELKQQLQASLINREADQAGRRAALNLMEDAVRSRHAEQAENRERRKVEEELRDASRRKDEFLATLAHELRNPLAPIRNSLHILRLRGDESRAVREVREIMERQVDHMVRLVDDLLEVSRITRGKIELHKRRVILHEVVAGAIETSKPLIEAGGHRLSVLLPEHPVALDVDPVRLAQVFANLLNNAAKYSDNGGHIELHAAVRGPALTVSVRDSGIGIPADMVSQVFEPFRQIDDSRNRRQGGLGIGLTLVRSLVELHGGTVSVRSEGVGRGCEFVVSIPDAVDSSPPQLAAPSAVSRRTDVARRILVVDDNCDAASSLGELFRLLNAEVRVVHNGADAVSEFSRFRPDVIVLDLGMPVLDGCEVARRIRALPGGPDVKLIALTGWGQPEDHRRTEASGFDCHFVKPLDVDSLLARLQAEP